MRSACYTSHSLVNVSTGHSQAGVVIGGSIVNAWEQVAVQIIHCEHNLKHTLWS